MTERKKPMTEQELLSTVESAIKQAKYNMNNGMVAPSDEEALNSTSASIQAKIKTLEEANSKIEGFLLMASGEPLYS